MSKDLSKSKQSSRQLEITKLSKAHSQAPGLKTAVPAAVARHMDWEAQDLVSWEFEHDEQGKYIKLRLHQKGKKEEEKKPE